MNNISIIKNILEILKRLSINNPEDLTGLILEKNKLLSAKRYTWVGEIAKMVNSLYYEAEDHITNIDGQIFLVNQVKKNNYENIMKYSCVFPDRTIISSGDFFYLNKGEFSFIDIDFFYKLFWCKDLLLQGIVHISPFYLRTDIIEGAADYENCMIEQLDLPGDNKKKIAELDDCGLGLFQDNKIIKKIYLTMPWLENACISDYIDIVNKNRAEFDFYNKCLSNISNISSNTDVFIKKYLEDYKEASKNIQIALEKKQSELRVKGITTFISLCLTAIPYFIPEGCVDPDIISAFLGVGTVKEMLECYNVYAKINMEGKDNPFWVLWKWKNKTTLSNYHNEKRR